MRSYIWVVIALVLAAVAVWWFLGGDPVADDADDTITADGEDTPEQAPALEGREAGDADGIKVDASQLKPGINVARGRVITRENEPVAGVEVTLRTHPRNMQRRFTMLDRLAADQTGVNFPMAPVATTTTDAEGQFEFRGLGRGSYRASVADAPPRYGNEQWVWLGWQRQQDIVLVMGEGTPLKLRVTDGAGNGLRAAIGVQVRPDPTIGITTYARSNLETDAEGRLTIGSVPKGTVLCSVGVKGRGWMYGIPVEVPHEGEAELVFGDPNGATITGRVTDRQGAPVPGARVSANTTDNGPPSRTTRFTVSTDADGTYRISGLLPGRLSALQAAAAGYVAVEQAAPDQEVAAGQTLEVDIKLLRGGVIEGRVLSSTGEPVRDVQLMSQVTGSSGIYARRAYAWSGRDGAFRLEGVPLGKGTIQVRAHRHYVESETADRMGRLPYEITEEGQRVPLDITLEPGVPVSGIVVDATGAPAKGVSVKVQNGRSQVMDQEVLTQITDAKGAFRFAGLPPGSGYRFEANTVDGLSEPVELTLHASEPPEDLRLTLYAGAWIGGRVEVEGMSPTSRVRVRLQAKEPDARGHRHTVTKRVEKDGMFAFPALRAGVYLISIVDGNGRPIGNEEERIVDWGTRAEDVVLKGERLGPLTATIVNGAGEPVPNLSLYVRSSQGNSFHSQGAHTNASGRFTIEGMRDLEYAVYVDDVHLGDLRIDEENTRLVYADAPEGGKVVIEGTVKMPDGAPLPSGYVGVTRHRPGRSTGTGGQIFRGKFRVELQVVHDDESIKVEISQAYDETGQPLNVRPWVQDGVDPDAPLAIQLEEGLGVSGHVVDADGKGIAGLELRLTRKRVDHRGPWNSRSQDATTDADGAFAFQGLDAENYEIRVQDAGRYVAPDPTAVDGGAGGVRIVLQEGKTVQGRVLDDAGKPVAQANLSFQWLIDIEQNGQRMKSSKNVSARSNGDGEFVLTGIPVDTLGQIWVNHPQAAKSGFMRTSVKDVQAGTQNLEIRLERGVYITGTITGPEGETVSNAWIWARPKDNERGQHQHAHVQAKSFRLGPLKPGAYTLTVQVHGELSAPKEPIEVTAPYEGLEIRLRKGMPIKGKVTGKLPRGHLHVMFVQIVNGQPHSYGTGMNGRDFLIPRDNDEAGTIYLRENGGNLYAILENVRPSQGPFTLELREGLTISGRVTGEVKEHQTYVNVRSEIGISSGIQVKPDGTFVVGGLPPGIYTVQGWGAGGAYEEVKDVKAGSEGIVLKPAAK